jgi:peptide deformylase
MVLPIVLYGDPVLRERGKPVTEITKEIRKLAENMRETMHEAHGVGLAAQQVGHALQLAVVELPEEDKSVTFVRVNGEEKTVADIMPLVFVNPKLELGKQKMVGEEGCLSFPDLRDDIRRSVAIKATLTLLSGETIVLETDGLLSRAIQHETDHLNGILFIDRMSPMAKLSLKRRLRELIPEWEADRKAAARK